MTTTTNHTAATLAALPPRELDALAHTIAMQRLYVLWHGIPLDCDKDGISGDPIPRYSISLDAAALLERELDKRDLDDKYADTLIDITCGGKAYLVERHYQCGYTAGCAGVWAVATASAQQRTIAAILAAREAK